MKKYESCISGPSWVLNAIKVLMGYTNKTVLGPYNKGSAKHIQIYGKK